MEKVDGAVIGPILRKRSSTCLAGNLPEVLVLREVQGFSQVRRKTSRGRQRRLQAMPMAKQTPTHDRTSSPVNQVIVPPEPGKPQNHGGRRGFDVQGLQKLTVITDTLRLMGHVV